MYIELFLLDNLLMNLLVLHLSAAILSVRPRRTRFFLFSLAASVYAAIGAGLNPILLKLPAKFAASIAMSFFLPCKNLREFLKNYFALIFSTLCSGGAVFGICLVFGSDFSSGIGLHCFILGIFIVSLLPGRFRKLLTHKSLCDNAAVLEVSLRSNKNLSLAALIDTGHSLCEPLSGLPVILLPAKYAKTHTLKSIGIVTLTTASGKTLLPIYCPASVKVNGFSVSAFVAFAHVAFAVVPPTLAVNHNSSDNE